MTSEMIHTNNSNHWDIREYRRIGSRNMIAGLRCQDEVLSYQDDKICVISLADGSGNSDLASEGAAIACHSAVTLLRSNFDDLFELSQEQCRFQVITTVQREIYLACEKSGNNPDAYKSTLLSFAIDLRSNHFLAFHLGDGMIRMSTESQGTFILSQPENGISKNMTFLTNHSPIGKHMRIYRGSACGIKEIFLTSDGWEFRNDHSSSADSAMDDMGIISMYRKQSRQINVTDVSAGGFEPSNYASTF